LGKIQGQALYNKRGEVVRIAIEENITNKKLLEEQRVSREFGKTNKELEDYAQIVSHDLSPL
jgi:light-regulated signal transduction histidine kinase (bacteriophytochrome)